MSKYILALDQGTTSSRAMLVDHDGKILNIAQQEFKQYFPKPGWVEHDAMEIWSSQLSVITALLAKTKVKSSDINAIGITNQRETALIWDRKTGIPIHPAIVWQDRRTATYCDQLINEGKQDLVHQKTGLLIDSYFSASKAKWILDNVEGAKERAEKGELAFGTIDSWLIWNLTDGQEHVTDVTNASRTMLYNIHDLQWDDELLGLFNIPKALLPEVKSSSEVYASTAVEPLNSAIPIAGIAGDQQSALFGQLCHQPGMVKNTYGTGCFMLMNTGDKPVKSTHKLLTTIAWQLDGKITYALEGSVFIGGAVVQWLRDGLGIIKNSSGVEKLATKVNSTDGVYVVPAFSGLGAPHWDSYARGAVFGITRGTTDAHIARACLESIAYQTYDVLDAMRRDAETEIAELRVDGGATKNDLLLEFQADVLNTAVVRPTNLETTAMGAAYFAGLATGFWSDIIELEEKWEVDHRFEPGGDKSDIENKLKHWETAVQSVKKWSALQKENL